MKNIAVYPVSANPPTLGHADILKRCSKKFDKIYWVVANNPHKQSIFTVEHRLAMMDAYIKHFSLTNVESAYVPDAVVRFAVSVGASFLIRGLRNSTDFQQEFELADGNRNINPGIETICLFTSPKYSMMSSSIVRELVTLNESISNYVIADVEKMIQEMFSDEQE